MAFYQPPQTTHVRYRNAQCCNCLFAGHHRLKHRLTAFACGITGLSNISLLFVAALWTLADIFSPVLADRCLQPHLIACGTTVITSLPFRAISASKHAHFSSLHCLPLRRHRLKHERSWRSLYFHERKDASGVPGGPAAWAAEAEWWRGAGAGLAGGIGLEVDRLVLTGAGTGAPHPLLSRKTPN